MILFEKMTELEELRKKVKEKQERLKIELETANLKEQLEEGTVKSKAKNLAKGLFKKLIK